MSVMRITLYDPETNEVKRELVRSFVPWRLLKKAISLVKNLSGKQLDASSLTAEDIDAIGMLVVEAFGDQFTLEELNNGADISEMITVLQTIVSKAKGNPTTPPVN